MLPSKIAKGLLRRSRSGRLTPGLVDHPVMRTVSSSDVPHKEMSRSRHNSPPMSVENLLREVIKIPRSLKDQDIDE